MTERIIHCPKCKTECVYSEKNIYRPFCSDRCKNSDIISWSEGEYSLEGPEANPEEIMEEIMSSQKDH